MKKLLYTLLAVSIIFSACKKEEDDIPQTMEDAVVGKRWIANNANDGFYLSEEGSLYAIYKCGEDVLLGDWIIEEDKIKYRYYENSLEITTLFCVVSEYTATQIKVVDSSNPTTTINIIYNVYTEVDVYGCMDVTALNYNPNADCDDGSCDYEMTYVPDNNFEFYLEQNGKGDGIYGNDSVFTANINTVTSLDVYNQNIADLTGIEAFTALTYLNCGGNQLTSLDVSQNTALTDLHCHQNQLSSLNVSQNTALTGLSCASNQLSSLNVSQNTALTTLGCAYNQLTTLDVSQNTALTTLACAYNQLSSLDVRNGNNTNFTYFIPTNNPNLYCIDVDNVTWSTANWTVIDPQSFFSNNCGSK